MMHDDWSHSVFDANAKICPVFIRGVTESQCYSAHPRPGQISAWSVQTAGGHHTPGCQLSAEPGPPRLR